MTKILSDPQVDQFHKNGFLSAFPVLSVDQAMQHRANLESFETENGGTLKGSLRFKNHLLFKWLSDLIRSPRILDTVEDIIGPDILVWSTDWWIKEANSPQFVSWHQDSQYWGLDTDKDRAALVRGKDNHHNFELEPEPRYDFDPVAVAFHNDSEEVRRQILYHGTDWTTHRT